MRKSVVILSTLALVTMLLTACAGEETSTLVPGTDVPPMTEEPVTEVAPVTETVGPTEEGTPGAGIPVTGEENPARLSNQLDYNVWDQNGEQIGEVNDMVLDLDNASVAYVIVGTGGFLEIGEKDILVPWNSLQLQTETGDMTGGEENAFILQTDQETFENAPDVDVNAVLPALGEPANDWDLDFRNYWESGVIPGTPSVDGTAMPDTTATLSPEATAMPDDGTTASELGGVALASEVLGSNISVGIDGVMLENQDQVQVQGTPAATAMPDATATPSTDTDNQGQLLDATLEDMIVNTDTGDIQYIVLITSFEAGERWIPVPLDLLRWDANNGTFVLDVDQPLLQGAPFFTDGHYPDMTVDGWDSDYSAYWP